MIALTSFPKGFGGVAPIILDFVGSGSPVRPSAASRTRILDHVQKRYEPVRTGRRLVRFQRLAPIAPSPALARRSGDFGLCDWLSGGRSAAGRGDCAFITLCGRRVLRDTDGLEPVERRTQKNQAPRARRRARRVVPAHAASLVRLASPCPPVGSLTRPPQIFFPSAVVPHLAAGLSTDRARLA